MIWWKGYLNRFLIRLFDILFSLLGLILLFPLMLILGLIIYFDSPGKIIFSQIRVGKNNTDFRLFKFRTMYNNAELSGLITVGLKDSRITKVGAVIRKYKLDELPQLLNVLRGQMSLVGPRPEVRHYTKLYTLAQQMIVFSVKPGITDHASIEYSKENELLSNFTDSENAYIKTVLPAKIQLNLIFIENYTLGNYMRILIRTIGKLISH